MAGEALSQEQIDALLRDMANGGEDDPAEAEADAPIAAPVGGFAASAPIMAVRGSGVPKRAEKKFTFYDFTNPKVFSKEQLRMMRIIYDNYAKHLSSIMSGRLRTECTISIAAIEELRFYEYNNGLQESIMMGVLEARPLEGSMLIEVDRDTAYLIIEKLLGWVGEEPAPSDNDFTDIEIKVFENFFTEISKYLREAWANVTDLEPRLDRIETNARLTQIMPLDEIVIVVMLRVGIHEYEGKMSICVPCLNLQALLDQSQSYLTAKRRKNQEDADKTKQDIFENLKTTRVDVRGILGSTTLSLQDLLYLQTGDVLPLDTSKDSLITLRVGSLDWYQGEVGTKKNRMAVKIISELQAKKELQKIL